MNSVCRDIFRAIHEGKWLKIEYKNKSEEITKYWIGIKNINAVKRVLSVDAMHLTKHTLDNYNIYIDSILSTTVIEGSFCPKNEELLSDIEYNPDKYRTLFDNAANLKILNYPEMCNKLDTTPYYREYELIKHLDSDKLHGDSYELDDEQFSLIVSSFSKDADKLKEDGNKYGITVNQLAINELSINTRRGLCVLAYRRLRLDVKRKTLVADDEVTVCTEFKLDGSASETARRYLDADEYEYLDDYEANAEKIKDAIIKNSGETVKVDDMPYIIGIGYDIVLDLHGEYEAIIKMYEEGNVSFPINAFFGNVLDKPTRKKNYPIALINNNINLDQLLAINKAMQYPTAYIQGPPGTGKTNTIINTIVTAFFNDRTVLFSSYNNLPIDGVFEKLRKLKYNDRIIPFPALRLGNKEKNREAVKYIRDMMLYVRDIQVFGKTLDKRRGDRTERAKRLSALLKEYEKHIDLEERRDTINRLLEFQKDSHDSSSMVTFNIDLQMRQLQSVNIEIDSLQKISDEEALATLDRNEEELLQYLFYASAKYVKRIYEDMYSGLRDIVNTEEEDQRLNAFSEYISKTENIKKLQRVFPVIMTTCLSAHKLGEPEPMFDMVIIDEASQCNTATTLVPIIRGENLMLVGDPQQLNPVILLDRFTNARLKKQYNVSDEYDYISNSIYKVFLACDSVSDEILLHNHYRCDPRIIGFNNRKYYNSQLNIKTEEKEKNPLVFVEVSNKNDETKNTAVSEARQIVKYASLNRDKSIGIITPFVNQKKLIEEELEKENLQNVSCGTVHAFQGDEKDIILFSTAINSGTQSGTYGWLKNNRELINVATSRAKEKLIILADMENVKRLHNPEEEDDFFELLQYVKENGHSIVTPKETNSRALGIKPFSTETEEAFLTSLTHALGNIWYTQSRCVVHKEVAISHVFEDNINYDGLFYTGRFDFVVYEKNGNREIPILAIELDGKEHYEDAVVKARDKRKQEICDAHNMCLIRVENSYARRYAYIKEILTSFFNTRR